MESANNKIEIIDSINKENNSNSFNYQNNNISINSEVNNLTNNQYHINFSQYQHFHNHFHNYQNDEYNHLSHEHNCENCKHKKHFGNIGHNYVFLKKYVFGPTNYLVFWLFCNVATVFGWIIWRYAVADYYSKMLYYILDVLCVVVEYYLILSYITEPGIIPRKCPDFAIKEVEQSEEKEKIKKEDKEKPNIYTERKCPTCLIIRPPGASHCRVCDNCVLDFDHHCVFISNCVGRRNHKYFVLFLVWGGLFAIITMCLVSRTIFYVFVIKYKETILRIIEGSTFLFLLSMFLIILCGTFFCNPFRRYAQIIITGLSGYAIFWRIWNVNVKKEKVPSYYTPLLFVGLGISAGLTIFIISNLVQQLYFISKGMTLKQNKSVWDKYNENKVKNQSNEALDQYINISCMDRIVNLIRFFCYKVDRSLIVPERDLIENNP